MEPTPKLSSDKPILSTAAPAPDASARLKGTRTALGYGEMRMAQDNPCRSVKQGAFDQENAELIEFFRPLVRRGAPPAPRLYHRPPLPRRWEGTPRCIADISALLALPDVGPLSWELDRQSSRSRGGLRGWRGRFQSSRAGCAVRTNSRLEFDFLGHCEVDPTLTALWPRPARLRVDNDEGGFTYRPDFIVLRRGTPWFVEVMWEASAAARMARWEIIGETLARLGFCFELLTEQQIDARPRAGNVRQLLRARRLPPVETELVSAVRRRLGQGATTLQDICAQVPGLEEKHVLRLLFEGQVITDMDVELTSGSPLAMGSPGAPA